MSSIKINLIDSSLVHRQVLVSSGLFLDYAWKDHGIPGKIVAIRQTNHDGCYAYILLDKSNDNAKSFKSFSDSGQIEIEKINGKIYKDLYDAIQWYTTNNPELLRLAGDSNYLSPEAAVGIHVCECGFINKDISISAIINGKYVCRQCRIIWKK